MANGQTIGKLRVPLPPIMSCDFVSTLRFRAERIDAAALCCYNAPVHGLDASVGGTLHDTGLMPGKTDWMTLRIYANTVDER